MTGHLSDLYTATMTDESSQEYTNDIPENRTKVGFPQIPEKASHFPWKIVLILFVVLLILGVFIWWILSGGNEAGEVSEELTPATVTQASQTETSTPTPTVKVVSKADIKIQILNGTGVPGGAGALKSELQKINFSDVETGNATDTNHVETLAVFSPDLDSSLKTEIVNLLEAKYSKVTITDEKITNFDVQITTGKGAAKTTTATPKISPTPTPEL